MNDLLSTENQEKAAKRLLKILSNRDLQKTQAVKKLTRPVKVQKDDGELVEKDPVYNNVRDAKELIKDLVKSRTSPIIVEDGVITRRDVGGGVA